jgi:hypothetical protein
MRLRSVTFGALAAAMLTAPALAHHSFAMFDAGKTVELGGTVKEFEWINPHVWLHVVATDPTGKPVSWSFEAGSPGQLTQTGWKSDTLSTGDKIILSFHPLKDGSHGGQLLSVTLPDGRTLCQGGACRERGND